MYTHTLYLSHTYAFSFTLTHCPHTTHTAYFSHTYAHFFTLTPPAQVGASVKDIYHERAWLDSDVMSVQIKCVVETRSLEHSKELHDTLLREGYRSAHVGLYSYIHERACARF
jgi:hypothetical protein